MAAAAVSAVSAGSCHAAQHDHHLFWVVRVILLQIIGHLRERAVLMLVHPHADRLTGCVQVDVLHVAVPHRPPPGPDPEPTPDPAARVMADASSPSRANVVNPVHR